MLRTLSLSLLSTIGLLLSATAQPTLDPTFGNNGKVLIDFDGDNDDAQEMLIQPDGRILVSGYGTIDGEVRPIVARLLFDGTLDPAFGTGGRVSLTLPAFAAIQGMALQPDGKVLVGGNLLIGNGADLFMARLLPNGALDPDYGTDGISTPTTSATGGSFWAMALQSDGKVLMSGDDVAGFNSKMMTVRLLADGALDTAFGTGGVALTDIGSNNERALAVAVQPNGKILSAGRTAQPGHQEIAVVRLLPNGQLDTSFDGDGILQVNISNDEDEASDLILLPDGRILVVGYASPNSDRDLLAVMLTTSGGFDPGFGTNGVVVLEAIDNQEVDRVAQDSEGGFVLTCTVEETFNDIRVLRLSANGTPDPMYDATFDINNDDNSSAIAIQVDGKVVVAGENNNGASESDMLVMRFTAPGTTSIPAIGTVSLSIAPNPSHGRFVAEAATPWSAATLVVLHDAQGRLVPMHPTTFNGKVAVDAEQVASGIYSLTLIDRGRTATERVVFE